MEASCWRTVDILRFLPPRIPHTVAVIVMALTFHTEYLVGMGYALNILPPDLYPLAGLETAILMWKWDAILGGGTVTFFAGTSLLMGNQKVAPIAGWDEAASQLEAWDVFCMFSLGDDGVHPATYEMFLLLEETSGVSPRLRAQACQQLAFTAALLRLIQQEFDESLHQVLEMWQRVQWLNLESLRRDLATVNFRLELVALPGGLAPQE